MEFLFSCSTRNLTSGRSELATKMWKNHFTLKERSLQPNYVMLCKHLTLTPDLRKVIQEWRKVLFTRRRPVEEETVLLWSLIRPLAFQLWPHSRPRNLPPVKKHSLHSQWLEANNVILDWRRPRYSRLRHWEGSLTTWKFLWRRSVHEP